MPKYIICIFCDQYFKHRDSFYACAAWSISNLVRNPKDRYLIVVYIYHRVVIRGDKDDTAVLCTDTQTYDIKQGEVSNTMLLLPNLQFGSDIKEELSPQLDYKQVHGDYNFQSSKLPGSDICGWFVSNPVETSTDPIIWHHC